MKAERLVFLEDPVRFKAMRDSITSMEQAEKVDILTRLEVVMKSSAWATKELFKPGIRNLYLQEQLGTRGMVKQFEHFLGDQEYQFKFFFQNAFASGMVPHVLDLLRQGINLPSFRFRLESLDMIVEIDGAKAVPVLFNLVSGLDIAAAGARDVVARIVNLLDEIAVTVDAEPAFALVFGKLRLLLVETSMRDEVNHARKD